MALPANMRRVPFAITMDLEPTKATSHENAAAPPNWEFSRLSMLAYMAVAQRYDLLITFCAHPEAAEAHADLLKQAIADGHAVVLHLHPWKFSVYLSGEHNGEFFHELGGLSEEEQRKALSKAVDMFEKYLGFRPDIFRPGVFSVSDVTGKVLVDLGFKASSSGCPDRTMPSRACIWSGSPRYPHYVHKGCHVLKGNLDLIDLPLSVDTSEWVERPKAGLRMHPDLRPDIDWEGEFGIPYHKTAANIFDQMIKAKPDVPNVNLVTHNNYGYQDPEAPVSKRLIQSLEATFAAAKERGIMLYGATLSDLNTMARQFKPEIDELPVGVTIAGK